MTNATQERFLTSSAGKYFNPDNAYGYQCKDLADAYAMAIFGKPWAETIRPGNGKDVFDNASDAYFTKVRNDPKNPRQLPPRGSIINWEWSAAVPEGHVAIVLSATEAGVQVLQQDGYAQNAAAIVWLPYTLPNGAPVEGWLIPKLATTAVQSRAVSQAVAWVRLGPGTNYALAPAFPKGIAKGGIIAVTGYVAGQDPFKTGDNAWYQTRSGFYVWANAAGNDLTNLTNLSKR